MDRDSLTEVLKGLYAHLERLETQSTAISLFLKEQKHITDKQLAPYLERAGNASNVRWRAERVRMEYLLTQKDVLTGVVAETENEGSAPSEVDQKAAREELAWQGSERDDSAGRQKIRAEDENNAVEQRQREAADATRDEQPEHDSSRSATAQAEPPDESRDDKEQGGQKVA